MNEFPISAIDRKIDALGDERRIRSEDDAKRYVDALLEKYRIDEKLLPGLAEFESRLVRAEYSAVLHPEDRIPEYAVAREFNKMMDEFQMPAWTRVSPQELHAFRATMSLALYPHSVSRLSNGNLPPTCRPVEALYLVYLLYANMGVQPELREFVRAGRRPAADPQALPSQGPLRLGQARKSPVEIQHLRHYKAALGAYLAAHPNFHPQTEVERLFVGLGIRE